MSVDAVEVILFDKSFASDFARLNYQWIEHYFAVEDLDREMLDDPATHIIERGGQIFFAVIDGDAVGTAALINDDDMFELAKMAVSTDFRGRGIGDRLIGACIEYAKTTQKRGIFLLSNTKLVPAISLYRKHGFVEKPLKDKSAYERVDIRMELAI